MNTARTLLTLLFELGGKPGRILSQAWRAARSRLALGACGNPQPAMVKVWNADLARAAEVRMSLGLTARAARGFLWGLKI